MKELKTKTMRQYLSRGLRKARRTKIPEDGMLTNLIYETKPNGWHYQVELVHDKRIMHNPYVVVYAFKPPFNFTARDADYRLLQPIGGKNEISYS